MSSPTSWSAMQMAMLLLAAASTVHGGAYHYGAPSYSPYAYHAPHVLTVLAERPLAASTVSAPMPLVVVPQDQLHVIHGDVSLSPRIKPFVQVKVEDHTEEAMPAVKVQLRRPILISSLQSTIPFPTRFTVLHNGYSQPLHVGSVIAPLPANVHVTPNHPAAINYVYAVPTGPYHFPAYHYPPQFQTPNFIYYSPVTSVAKPVVPVAPAPAPAPSAPTPGAPAAPAPAAPARPTEQTDVQAVEAQEEERPKPQDPQVQNRPQAPIVTVLDFPTNVAQPPALFYQPPATGLGNREPPQAVAPAGIVQSTAPIPNLSVFVNSKESPYLQILRDEAQRNRIKQASQYPAGQEEEQVVFVN